MITLTKRIVILLITSIIIVTFSACMPSHGTVTSRQTQTNMPGGEGPHHTLINICVRSADGKDSGCENFPPSQVNQCHVGSKWPDCQ
jgi:hypothetical protein